MTKAQYEARILELEGEVAALRAELEFEYGGPPQPWEGQPLRILDFHPIDFPPGFSAEVKFLR